MTTYDEIYSAFLNICKSDNYNYPQTEEKVHDFIENSIKHYNNKMHDNLKNDNELEVIIDRVLTDDELIILAHCMKYIFLKNQLNYYVTTFKPFQKEVGLMHYQTDVKALENLINKEEEEINELIENTIEDWEV